MVNHKRLFPPQIIRTVKGRGNQAESSKSRSGGGGSSDGTMHLVHENETLKVCNSLFFIRINFIRIMRLKSGEI